VSRHSSYAKAGQGEGFNGRQVASQGNGKVYQRGDAQEDDELSQDAGGDGFEAPAESTAPVRRKRAPKGSFNPTKLELQNLRDTMTVKQIAELKGVSAALVNNKLREFGLTNPNRGRPARKSK